jgi:DNA-directed RNA polymerase specialized sigma24 family protein
MDQRQEWLARRFEEHRTHLRAVAYRMLGLLSEAEDAVQEAWLRLSRSDTTAVENRGRWLTTVVARVCLKDRSHIGPLAGRRQAARQPCPTMTRSASRSWSIPVFPRRPQW